MNDHLFICDVFCRGQQDSGEITSFLITNKCLGFRTLYKDASERHKRMPFALFSINIIAFQSIYKLHLICSCGNM